MQTIHSLVSIHTELSNINIQTLKQTRDEFTGIA